MINVLTEDWHIESQDLELRNELGRGAFGRVVHGKWRNSPVAIKIAHPPDVPATTNEDDGRLAAVTPSVLRGIENNAHLWREVGMMMRLHHPNIVQYLGFSVLAASGGSVQPCIVMEYIAGQTLEAYIRADLPSAALHVSRRTKRRLCLEMTLAIEYLHGRRPSFITHRDLKPENFLLTRALHVKLADFGISRLFDNSAEDAAITSEMKKDNGVAALPQTLDSTQTSDCGTVRFMAPEVFGSATGNVEANSATTTKPAREDSAGDTDGSAGSAAAIVVHGLRASRGSADSTDGRVKSIARYSTAADMFSLGLVYYFVFEVHVERASLCCEFDHRDLLFTRPHLYLQLTLSVCADGDLSPLSLQRVLPRLEGCTSPSMHIAALRAGRQPQFSGSTPAGAVRVLLKACYDRTPRARPSATQAIEVWQALEADARAGFCAALWRGRREGLRAVSNLAADDASASPTKMEASAAAALALAKASRSSPAGDASGENSGVSPMDAEKAASSRCVPPPLTMISLASTNSGASPLLGGVGMHFDFSALDAVCSTPSTPSSARFDDASPSPRVRREPNTVAECDTALLEFPVLKKADDDPRPAPPSDADLSRRDMCGSVTRPVLSLEKAFDLRPAPPSGADLSSPSTTGGTGGSVTRPLLPSLVARRSLPSLVPHDECSIKETTRPGSSSSTRRGRLMSDDTHVAGSDVG
jgi:serine/threonine protein kinase